MNVWGFPKIMGKGAFFFFQGLMRKQGVHHLKNCENNSREALFFFSFFSNLLSCLLKQRYKHVCM